LLQNGLAVSRGFDDKVGSFVVAETMRLIAKKKIEPAVYCVSTVQEEIGSRGAKTSAFGIEPDAGIAVDVDHASDYPGADKAIVGDIKLGSGPVLHRGASINPVLGKILINTAKKNKIPYQMSAEPGVTRTDTDAIFLTRTGVASALVGIPTRYMHTPVEVVSLDDLSNAAKLIASFLVDMKGNVSFIP
jgi:endoglucanase